MPAHRVISPPRSEIAALRTPLTPGESDVFAWLDANLPAAWEIYVQPHLNGLRPDFVLLHPLAGIVVIEVKDWQFDVHEYSVFRSATKRPSLQLRLDGRWIDRTSDNPITKLHTYADEIRNIYCPCSTGAPFVSCVAIAARASQAEAVRLLGPLIKDVFRTPAHAQCAVLGQDALATTDCSPAVGFAENPGNREMTPDLADDLRHWLVEPEYSAEQREPLALNQNQQRFATERTSTGYRRIKGPAGSGKSLVLAARAAALVSQGKSVLCVTFNLTLINYLQDLASRSTLPPGRHIRRDITWINFHMLCRRICFLAGRSRAYNAHWAGLFQQSSGDLPPEQRKAAKDLVMNEWIPATTSSALTDHPFLQGQYDAILVDEGQDFRPDWIKLLRLCLRQDGEFLLVADKSQNVYDTARMLTEEAMDGCGFRGQWAELDECYRMPTGIIPFLRAYAETYLPADLRDTPAPPRPSQGEFSLLDPCFLRWVQTSSGTIHQTTVDEILRLARAKDIEHLPIADITLLTFENRSGKNVVESLDGEGIKSIHTFADSRHDSNSLKRAFYKGSARVKATTIYSFKGLESRALIICIDRSRRSGLTEREHAAVYTAISRLKRTPRGAYLTVVCSSPSLEAYGRTWPNFVSTAGEQ